MARYVLLTRLNPDAVARPESFNEVSRLLARKIKEECPEVTWITHYLILGPYDYLDIFEAPDNESAAKVAVLVRTVGHGTTEIWPAVAAERFREVALALAQKRAA